MNRFWQLGIFIFLALLVAWSQWYGYQEAHKTHWTIIRSDGYWSPATQFPVMSLANVRTNQAQWITNAFPMMHSYGSYDMVEIPFPSNAVGKTFDVKVVWTNGIGHATVTEITNK